MLFDKPPPRDYRSYSSSDEAASSYTARNLQQQAELLEQRQKELVEQSSPSKTPRARILLWERIHQARLPTDPSHGLVAVIAAHTGITVEQVHEEQRARAPKPVVRSAEPPAAAPPETAQR